MPPLLTPPPSSARTFPIVDRALGDPRWGRNWEVASECPYLTGQIAAQYAKGFQTGSDDRFLLGVITLKHWMGYGVEANRTSYDSMISRFDLVDSYLPQWRAAVEEGRAAGVMCRSVTSRTHAMDSDQFITWTSILSIY